jgi:hypothetical protein
VKAVGFRKKPLWIYFMSALFILSPIFNFMFSLRGRGEPGWMSPVVWWEWLPHTPARSFFVSALLLVTGFLIGRVNRWSWFLAISSLVVLCGYNLMLLRGLVNNNFFVLFIVSVLMGAFLWILYQSEFRQVFLDRRLRWWESKPRFKVNLPVTIKGSRADATLLDLSRSGFLLSTNTRGTRREVGDVLDIEITQGVVISARIVRITSDGFAVQIEKIGRYESRYLHSWIKMLSKEGKKISR